MSDHERTTSPACIDCGEPDSGSCPEGRCRDCDHDYLFASSQCRECGRCIMSAQYFGPLCDQHGRDCSLRDAVDCLAPEDAAMWRERFGLTPGEEPSK